MSDSKFILAGVMGWPVSHSRSPAIHNHWIEQLGLDGAYVSDAIYIPLEAPLLAQAKLRGHLAVNGLGMLLNQARPAFQAWFGVLPELTPELRAAVQATF